MMNSIHIVFQNVILILLLGKLKRQKSFNDDYDVNTGVIFFFAIGHIFRDKIHFLKLDSSKVFNIEILLMLWFWFSETYIWTRSILQGVSYLLVNNNDYSFSATMTKIIKEMLPPDVRVARDTQDLLIECCVGA